MGTVPTGCHPPETVPKKTFEESLNELEKIVAKLESGECSLDESIKLFEEGVKFAGDCRTALKEAQSKILTLTEAEENDD